MSGATEVRKGVPMPRAQSSRTLDLPFESMDVGDSFEVEIRQYGDTESDLSTEQYGRYAIQLENRVRSAAYRNGKRLGLRFAVRRLDDYTLGIWRTR